MKAQLEIKDGTQAGRKAEISRLGSYSIGRRSVNDLKIVEEGVSRKHCRIDYDGEFFWLVDSDSRNGTFVNGRKVSRTLLYDGDVIRVGRVRLLFSLPQQESEEPARL